MASIILNKLEKEKRVIELHLGGKTIRDIAKEVHMSFRDISKIIKRHDKKVRLEAKKEEIKNNQSKKLSTSSQALKLFSYGKQPTEVAIILDINYERVSRLWSQFLKLEKKYESYEFYLECQNDLPALLSINSFIKRNNIHGKDIVNVLRTANDVVNLNKILSNLNGEIANLRQIKNNCLSNKKPIQNYQQSPLQPLPKPVNWNY